MFLDEAKILLAPVAPHIIDTREVGIAEHARFIAMELLLGRSLIDALDICAERESRVPLDLAAYIARASRRPCSTRTRSRTTRASPSGSSIAT